MPESGISRQAGQDTYFDRRKADRGTAFTIKMAEKHKKPYLVIDLGKNMDSTGTVNWIKAYGIAVLNVAGPRESKTPAWDQ